MFGKAPEINNRTETNNLNVVDELISYGLAASTMGHVLVARSGKGVCALLMGDDPVELRANLAERFPLARLVDDEAAVQGDFEKVGRYLDHPGEGLSLSLDVRGTPFQRRVWEKVRSIRPGRTLTYAELAHLISPLASPRAVAGACAANPIALAIPCHRVVAQGGVLAGYRWGIERKRDLLAKEAMA